MVIVVLLLAVVALLVVRAIRQNQLQTDITDARTALAEGTAAGWARFDALLGEHGGLDSDDPRVVALAAFGAAERAVLLGAPTAEAARAAIARMGNGGDENAMAARAWAALLSDVPAMPEVTQAAHAFPSSGPIRHAHALTLWAHGLTREAVTEIGAARTAEPAYLPAALTQADLLRRAGQIAAARQVLANVPAMLVLRGAIEAACALDEAEATGAAPVDVTALVSAAEQSNAPRYVARAKLARGRQKLLAGDAEAAVPLLQEAARLDPSEPEVATQLSRALWRSGDAKGAVAAVDAAGTRAAPAALAERALAAALLHRTSDAETTLGRVPAGAVAAEKLASIRALLAWQKLDAAGADSEAATATGDDDPTTLVRRAEAQLALVKRGAAVRALKESPSACARAYAQWIEGDWPAAQDAMEAARATEPACATRLIGRTSAGLRPPAEVVAALEASLRRDLVFRSLVRALRLALSRALLEHDLHGVRTLGTIERRGMENPRVREIPDEADGPAR